MNNSGYVQTSKNPDLITYKVLIDGAEIPNTYSVFNISVEKEVNRVPKANITLLDGDAASQDFEISNEEFFIPGKEIEITAGYHSEEETIFKGIIIKHGIKVRNKSTFLLIECRDEAVKMTLGRKSRYFYTSTDSDIIQELIGNYGLSSDVETTSIEYPEMIQYRASDWDFMITRAQFNGQLCFVDDGTITIASPDISSNTQETVVFGSSIYEFDGEIDARHQYSSIASYSWDMIDQTIIETEAEDPGLQLNGNITAQDLASALETEDLQLRHGGQLTLEELQEWSNGRAIYQQLAKTRGRVRFQGIPNVKPGQTLQLEGLGNRFNGVVYVTGIRHEIVEGNWMIDAQFGINPELFSETFDISDKPASGVLPAINGLQIGVTTQLEEDPDGEDRILVQIPIIDGEQDGIWARVATLDAGENRGSFFRPEIGDEVIVGFINDDPNEAVILGMLNSSAKPAPIVASDDNHEKGWVTRSEMKMLFNDDTITYSVETPAGKKITIDEDQDIITVNDDHDNIITLNPDGITIESAGDINIIASGDLNMEATNISIAASASFVAEGGSGSEVSSGAITVIKGSQVQIN